MYNKFPIILMYFSLEQQQSSEGFSIKEVLFSNAINDQLRTHKYISFKPSTVDSCSPSEDKHDD